MVETTKLPIKSAGKSAPAQPGTARHPFEDLRHEIDRLFEDFGRTGWLSSLRGVNVEPLFRARTWNMPAVDIAEKEKSFEVTAELPGLDPNNVEVTLRNGNIVISGEKHEQSEESSKDFYVKERQYGSFERAFPIPDDVDTSKIDATFKNGILNVTMPKKAEAQKPVQKVAIKAA